LSSMDEVQTMGGAGIQAHCLGVLIQIMTSCLAIG
jgi:hypothetical protein